MWSFENIIPVAVEFAWHVSTRLSGEEVLSPRRQVQEVKEEPQPLPASEQKQMPAPEQKEKQAQPEPAAKKPEDLWTIVEGFCYIKKSEKIEPKREDAIAIVIDTASKEAKERALQVRKELKKELPVLIYQKGSLQICDMEEMKYENTLSQVKPKIKLALDQLSSKSFSLFKKTLGKFEELPWELTDKKARDVIMIIERAEKQIITWQNAWREIEVRCSPLEKERRKIQARSKS